MYLVQPFHIQIYFWNLIWKTSTKNCPYLLLQPLKLSINTAFRAPIPNKPFKQNVLKFGTETFQEVANNHARFKPRFKHTLLATLCVMLCGMSFPCLHKVVYGTYRKGTGEECLWEVCTALRVASISLVSLHQTSPVTYLVN